MPGAKCPGQPARGNLPGATCPGHVAETAAGERQKPLRAELDLFHRLVQDLVLLLVLEHQELVLTARLGGELTLEAAERFEAGGIEATVLGGAGDRAARFGVVLAVAEVTSGGQRMDVGEGVLEAALPELHLAHARRVDEQPAAGELEQLAVRRGVP